MPFLEKGVSQKKGLHIDTYSTVTHEGIPAGISVNSFLLQSPIFPKTQSHSSGQRLLSAPESVIKTKASRSLDPGAILAKPVEESCIFSAVLWLP